jgi:hypothetical protein
MAEARLLPPPCRSCEESIAFRATVSPPHLRRILPKPALPPVTGPTPAQQLRQLLQTLDGPKQALYTRLAERAIEDGAADSIAQVINSVQVELDSRQRSAAKLQEVYPLLYPKKVA